MKATRSVFVLLLCAATLLVGVNDAAAQAGGRVTGTVKDGDGNPIEDVQVSATSPDIDGFKLEKTTNKKGKFVLVFADSAVAYVVEIKKEGYETVVTPFNPVAGQTAIFEYVLAEATTDEQAAAEQAALNAARRAILVYNEGVEAQRSGNLEQAAKKYREAATVNPELAAARTSLAGVAHLQGNYETAVAEAEAALAIDPTDGRAMQLRFDSYRRLGDTAGVEAAAKALQEFGGARNAAAQIFNEAADTYTSGNVADAISKFQQAADLDPTLVPAQLVLAKLFYAEGSLPEALTRAENVIALEPENNEALQIAYGAALRLGESETASRAVDALVASDPEWATTALFQQGVDLYDNGQTDEAVATLKKVLEVEPDHAKAHYMLGVALFNTGQTGPAADHLQRFIEMAPDDPDVAIANELLAFAD